VPYNHLVLHRTYYTIVYVQKQIHRWFYPAARQCPIHYVIQKIITSVFFKRSATD